MRTALEAIFDAYAEDLPQARDLTDTDTFPVIPESAAPRAQAIGR
jgi:hypothetical protein